MIINIRAKRKNTKKQNQKTKKYRQRRRIKK